MTKQVFVIMPFSGTSEEHSEKYWTDFFEEFIKPTMQKFGYSCKRSQTHTSNIVKDILVELLNADLVIAVLTDSNVNVWYELGVRHARRNGTIMVIEENQKIPFDISHCGIVKYRDTIIGLSDFEKKIASFLEGFADNHMNDSPVMDLIGSKTQQDYESLAKNLKEGYDSKLEKIVTLLQTILEGKNTVKKNDEKIGSRRRVLWVDDYPSNNEAIIDLYRVQGVEFDLAINSDQAFEALRKNEYDLLITDLVRGSQRDAGLRLLKELKRDFGRIPPVFVFASTEAVEQYGKDAVREGASLVTDSTGELMRSIRTTLRL